MPRYRIFSDAVYITDNAEGPTHEAALIDMATHRPGLVRPGVTYAVLRQRPGGIEYADVRILRLNEISAPRFEAEGV